MKHFKTELAALKVVLLSVGFALLIVFSSYSKDSILVEKDGVDVSLNTFDSLKVSAVEEDVLPMGAKEFSKLSSSISAILIAIVLFITSAKVKRVKEWDWRPFYLIGLVFLLMGIILYF